MLKRAHKVYRSLAIVNVVCPSSKTLPVRWLEGSSRNSSLCPASLLPASVRGLQVIRAVNCVWLSFWKLDHWWKCFVLVDVDLGDICKLRETGVLQACDLYKLTIVFPFLSLRAARSARGMSPMSHGGKGRLGYQLLPCPPLAVRSLVIHATDCLCSYPGCRRGSGPHFLQVSAQRSLCLTQNATFLLTLFPHSVYTPWTVLGLL